MSAASTVGLRDSNGRSMSALHRCSTASSHLSDIFIRGIRFAKIWRVTWMTIINGRAPSGFYAPGTENDVAGCSIRWNRCGNGLHGVIGAPWRNFRFDRMFQPKSMKNALFRTACELQRLELWMHLNDHQHRVVAYAHRRLVVQVERVGCTYGCVHWISCYLWTAKYLLRCSNSKLRKFTQVGPEHLCYYNSIARYSVIFMLVEHSSVLCRRHCVASCLFQELARNCLYTWMYTHTHTKLKISSCWGRLLFTVDYCSVSCHRVRFISFRGLTRKSSSVWIVKK